MVELIRAIKAAGIRALPRSFRAFGKLWPLPRGLRDFATSQGWEIAPRDDDETIHEFEKALLVMQGYAWNSPEYLAWLDKRQEILKAARSRRIRDYYKTLNGHSVRKRNEAF